MIFKKLLNNKVKEIAEQRKVLTETFPYTDWKKIPYTQYDKFLSLKDLIGECGAVWTNAFGRSNTEAEDTRKYLKDYSGNGRDIELFNFGYSKQSGYNGYVQDFRNFNLGSEITNSTITESKISVTNTNISEAHQSVGSMAKANYTNKGFRIKVSSLSSWAVIIFYTPDYSGVVKAIDLKEGIVDIPALTDEEWSSFGLLSINIPKNASVTVEQIAPYQGAIVGDGIDDYGQCVKDFSLPSDYTVVAMRETLVNSGTLIGKNKSQGNPVKPGAFCFEIGEPEGVSLESYYDVSTGAGITTIASMPKLFSYQTKSSYNGQELNVGSGTDTDACKLNIFRSGENTTYFKTAALYSCGVFNRTLTAEELALVEDCMYLELEYNTNILDNIEYYDILDARYRSNEEAEDKRNKWNGRLGKLHLTLNNYGYSGMSGWNGTRYNFISLGNISTVIGNKITITQAYSGINTYSVNPPIVDNILSLKAKFTGIDRLVQRGEITGVYLIVSNSSGESLKFGTQATKDGTIELSVDVNGVEGIARASLYVALKNTQGATLIPLSSPITIDVIPDYGGALVSDGVDDYAVSDEVIDENLEAFVLHAEGIGSGGYVFSNDGVGIVFNDYVHTVVAAFKENAVQLGNPYSTDQSLNKNGIYGFSLNSGAPNRTLHIGKAADEYGSTALYQLRLIKTQPTDIQLEVIKQQVLREHNDYIKEMGWE